MNGQVAEVRFQRPGCTAYAVDRSSGAEGEESGLGGALTILSGVRCTVCWMLPTAWKREESGVKWYDGTMVRRQEPARKESESRTRMK